MSADGSTGAAGAPTAARAPIQGPCAWRGAELRESDWLVPLPEGAGSEIEAALAAVKARGLDLPGFGRDDFPLPKFGAVLAEARRELEEGRGFLRLRGLPVDAYDEADLRRVFWGLAAHLGTARYQSAVGELIGEVRDEVRAFGAVREAYKSTEAGAPLSSRAKSRSNGPLRFHTDRCDAIALLCVRASEAGGTSKVVSAVAVHNEILARRPDLLEVLYGDYYRCRVGEERSGAAQAYRLPVFAVERGHFTTQYSRTFVEEAPTVAGVPPLTTRQVAAIDLLHEVAEEICLRADFEPGDLLLINNHVVYHGRDPFEDGPGGLGRDVGPGEEGRLLLRIWLSMANSRPLPKGHAVLWGATEAGALRGGIAQPE
ncbi:MAG: TauD/TfdA family dioxygenase [Kiloniellales bacterium]